MHNTLFRTLNLSSLHDKIPKKTKRGQLDNITLTEKASQVTRGNDGPGMENIHTLRPKPNK